MKNGRYEEELGTIRWYLNGEFHREDGPAIVFRSGYKVWFFEGKLHREDGPAVDGCGIRHWWVNGCEMSKDEFDLWREKKGLHEKLEASFQPTWKEKKKKI